MEQTRQELEKEINDSWNKLRHSANTMEQIASQKLDKFSISHQIEKNPVGIIGASIGAGAILGLVSRKKTPSKGAPLERRSLSRIALSEVGHAVAPLALRIAMGFLGDWARKKYPKAQGSINAAEQMIVNRL